VINSKKVEDKYSKFFGIKGGKKSKKLNKKLKNKSNKKRTV
jgi:hypothetical protein